MQRIIDIGGDGRVFTIVSDETYELVHGIYPIGVQETLTAATPAVSLGCYLTDLDATSNGVAATLADGAVHGQLKCVQASVVSGGAVTLTLTSAESASLNVITFTVIGDRCLLMWFQPTPSDTGYWKILSRSDTDGDLDTPTVA